MDFFTYSYKNMNEDTHIWLDGKFISKAVSNISPLTHGLHYGTGAFEGIRVYNGKIFKLDEHLNRLFHSATVLLMELPFLISHLRQACLELVKLNKIKDGYIRPLIFLGNQHIAVGAENNIHVMIACWSRPSPYYTTLEEKKSLHLQISDLVKLSPKSFLYSAKASGLYILNHIAKKRAINAGYDDALMFDYRGYIAESTTSNFFLVKNQTLHTPTTECCLDGITRQVIIKLAKTNGLEVMERHISKEELSQADEVFLTGTAAEIKAVRSIEENQYKDNPISQLLYKKFYELTQSL